MPIETLHYSLEAHVRGDSYSASIDQRRFLIIDNQLAFLSDQVTNGRIDGWEVTISDLLNLELNVSPGLGIIDRFVTRTFNNLSFTLADNKTVFMFMKRRQGVLGGFSGFSNLDSITASDSVAPAVPTGIQSDGVTLDQIDLSWDANTEVDLSHYVVSRSLNNITFAEIGQSTSAVFLDTGLQQNTNYYYKLTAVDLSGNESAETSSFLVKSLKDLREPLPPAALDVFPGDTIVQLLWIPSSFGSLDRYEIHVQELDESGIAVGAVRIETASKDSSLSIIDDLVNNTLYSFTVFAVNINEVFSVGLTKVSTPSFKRAPAEVTDLQVTFAPGENDDINVVMTVSWTPSIDPYLVPADYYQIILVENAVSESDPITVRDADTRDISIIPFTGDEEDAVTTFQSVKPNTNYFVQVQAVSDNGDISSGIVVFVSTPLYETPASISNPVASETANKEIFASWQNSNSEFFSYNLLTASYVNNDTQVETSIVSSLDIGKANTYTVDSSFFDENRSYNFSVVAVDSFGNESATVDFVYTSLSAAQFERPEVPLNQSIADGDGVLELRWSLLESSFVASYRVWRADFSLFATAASFQILDTVPNDIASYQDFTVTNDVSYMYFVTTIDIFGQESFNPVDDGFISYNLLVGTPKDGGSFVPPLNLSVSASGRDAILAWDLTAGAFDGYEVFRSEDNKYSFELAGQVIASDLSFTDEDVLLKDGVQYYYIVRKIRNEADLFVTETNVAPIGSIILAEITSSGGDIEIDKTVANEIKNLEDPIREETQRQLALHKHVLEEDGTDKRIDLSSDLVVSDWTTTDFQNYFTEEDIGGSSAFVVSVNGAANEEFFTDDNGNVNQAALDQIENGILPFLFEVSSANQRITFGTALFSDETAESPFSSPPTIFVTILGVSEIDGILPADKVGDFSATQVTSGLIKALQMPVINHDGRIGEELVPVSTAMDTVDGFNFNFQNLSTTFDRTTTFHDILKVSETELLAATSRGVLYSDDFGVTWAERLFSSSAPLKLFYSVLLDKHFAITNNEVFVTKGTLLSWSTTNGLENVKVIRDIVEDNSNNIFISTDLGVYQLVDDAVSNLLRWEQSRIFGPQSTEAYAMLYDTDEDRILVSNELGILETRNAGITWSLINEFDESKKLFVFIQDKNTIFALANDSLWRRSASQFVKVADLDGDVARKMVIFNNRIYLTTDAGTFVSDADGDIFNDVSIVLEKALPEVNIKNKTVPVSSLNVIDDLLLVGIDQKLFIRDTDITMWIQFESLAGSIPTVFVDSVEQKIGFRYNAFTRFGSNDFTFSVSFDEKISFDSNVSVTTEYTQFQVTTGGWADHKFDSRIMLKLNNGVLADSNDLEDGIALDVSTFSSFAFPEFTERNSFFAGAELAQTDAQSAISRLVFLNSPTEPAPGEESEFAFVDGETISDVVANAFFAIERFLSQVFPEARTVEVEVEGVTSTEEAALPEMTVDLNEDISVNTTTGLFTFATEYSKYDLFVTDIIGATIRNIGDLSTADCGVHRFIEDEFELRNSGLPSSLSQVQQANIVKIGLFNERTWPDRDDICSTPYQSKYITLKNQSSYDVLNSTVDYSLETAKDDISLTLPYASTAVFIEETNSVLVGGLGGMFLIDPDNFAISESVIPGLDDPFIKQLHIANNTLYAVTSRVVYESFDGGVTWAAIDRTGLPNSLFSIGFVNNRLIVGAEDGIYFKTLDQIGWSKAISSTTPVELLIDPDLVFAFVDNKLHFSSDGVNFVSSGDIQTLKLNSMVKYTSLIYVGTDTGLYKDDGTFYGSEAKMSLADILGDVSESAQLIVNDVVGDSDKLVSTFSGGTFSYLNGNVYTNITTPLEAIQTALLVNGDIWVFGYDLFIVYSDPVNGDGLPKTEFPIKLSTGAPV